MASVEKLEMPPLGIVGYEPEQGEEPRLVVEVSLPDLTLVDLALFYTRLAVTATGNHHELLVVDKAPDGHGRIR